MYLIVVYDISNIKLQTKIRNFVRRYLNHTQLSVFEGEVTPSQFVKIDLFFRSLHLPENESVVIYKLRDQSKVMHIIYGKNNTPRDINII